MMGAQVRNTFCAVILLAAVALPVKAATSNAAGPEKIKVCQLEQVLTAAQGKPDAEVAQQLSGLELIERLNSAKLARWQVAFPGERTRQALLILADSAVFLDPPNEEILANPTPDPGALRQMLVQVVNYVNTTIHQLPNFIATRETTGFEDRPQEDIQQETSVISLSYLPLHVVGRSSATVTYRDGHEVVDEGTGRARQKDTKQSPTDMTGKTAEPMSVSDKPEPVGPVPLHGSAPDVAKARPVDAVAQEAPKARKRTPQVNGLATEGEFGPILSTVLADALKGKITWARWEQGAGEIEAVFHYTVPREKSNYVVKFCCVSDGVADGLHTHVYGERAGYHGEIAFNPESGAILRMGIEAEITPRELVSRAGMVVEFGPVEIGGKSYICPSRSVSVLLAHTARPRPGMHMAIFEGKPKTFLNDVEFGQYRRFGSESRVLTGDYVGLPAKP